MIVESNDEESSSQNESQRISVTLRNAVQSCGGMAETSLSTISSSETREMMLVGGRLSSRCAISMGQLPIVEFVDGIIRPPWLCWENRGYLWVVRDQESRPRSEEIFH